MLRYFTSGESHGKALVGIIDGIPSGLKVSESFINNELKRRKAGYGRGRRMDIESDKVEVISGLRRSVTIGSPISFVIKNTDNSIDKLPPLLCPRPGHADLSGMFKYDMRDGRSVLERASARETAMRVALGAVCKIFLRQFGIDIFSHVINIGSVEAQTKGLGFDQLVKISEKSPVRCADRDASSLMCIEIDDAMEEGDTLGGVFELIIRGTPPGLGSYVQWDRRIDGRLAQAIMSIQAIKAVSFGAGFESSRMRGSMVHDQIFYEKNKGFYRNTNNAGGIEGGMTNGEAIVIHAGMKPIATLVSPLNSVNIKTKKNVPASVQRSDVCAVPAAGIVAEAVSAVEIASEMLRKFGNDSMGEVKRSYDAYIKHIKNF